MIEEDKKKKKGDKESLLKEARKAFKACQERSQRNRENGLRDLRFAKMGEQWPERVMKERELEGRPCLTINRLPSFIRQVVNDSRQNKPQIKVHPVDSNADIETAKIYSGLIRNIETVSRADIAYDTAIDCAVTMGFGYIRVGVDYACSDSFDQDIEIQRIANPLTVFEDPYSQSADGSDWNVCFVTEMVKKEDFEKDYPDAEAVNWESDGRDDLNHWFEGEEIRVAEYWKREKVKDTLFLLSDDTVITKRQLDDSAEGNKIIDIEGLEVVQEREIESYKVTQHLITAVDVLEENEWPGMYIPIIPVYGEEFNVEGKRVLQSLIHQAKDTQRNFNYWRSAATELVALAPKTPFIGPKGAFKSDPNWDTANTKNHPYLEYDTVGGAPPARQPFAGMPAGALQEALNASDDLKSIIGIHDASLGARSNETSGRAIIARQKEGDTSTFHFIDNMTRAIRQVGAVLINLIPHVYSKQRIIRILGEDGTTKSVPINQEIMVDEKGEVLPPDKEVPENIEAINRVYDLTNGKYDLTVSSGPSFNSRREEAAYQMTEFVRSFPQSAPIIGDLLAKNLDWPGADEVAERLKEINPVLLKEKQGDQPPPPDPEMMKIQAQAQLEQQKAQQKAQIDQQQAQQNAVESEQEFRIANQKAQADLALKEKDLIIKEMEIRLKELDIVAQKEKNEVELIKARVGAESQIRKDQKEIDQEFINNQNQI